MGTKNFNFIDNLISYLRLGKIVKYIEQGETILDFGCGYQAYFLHQVRKSVKEGIGVDYEVENTHSENIKLIKLRYKDRLPFESGYFDKIFLLAVVEHVDLSRIRKLVAELYRVLVPGGSVILTTPTPASKPLLEFLAFRLGIISSDEIRDHKKYYSQKDLIDVFCNKNKFVFSEYSRFQFGLNSLARFQKNG